MVKRNKIPDADYLNTVFEYKGGLLYWRESGPGRRSDMIAGSKRPDGYYSLHFSNTKFLLHRVIFKMHHGFDPLLIDHINGIPGDNRIENLQAISYGLNHTKALKASRLNTSGIVGVNYVSKRKKWSATIANDGLTERKFFDTKEAAIIERALMLKKALKNIKI